MKSILNYACATATGAVLAALALHPMSGSKPTVAQPTPAPPVAATSGIVKVDDANVDAIYANFARVTATPEEVMLDFAMNPQPFAEGEQSVKASRRLAMNLYTAKRLVTALQITVDKHEKIFGPIELDVRKRARESR
ncbi:DUF3467 domain-containing protein [Aquisphaera insulae]|uniref:DUF3467 domain-containing protein n=1 Tax=Aquisphaera insulae TaxID=2712864 RepID=UPI002030B669|nr:DUF3467 domain-containing protein [Aquisphaera insulae]